MTEAAPIPESAWNDAYAAVHLKADLLVAHALVHYIHEGHPYRLALRSPNALPWLTPGEYALIMRIQDSNALWMIRDRLARERGIKLP